MAVQGSIIDYTGGAGDRNFTVYIQLAFSGSYTTQGDILNLTSTGTLPLLNPNGLDIEGFFELPLTLGPSVYIENLDGYYIQPSITQNVAGAFTGLTLSNVPIMLFAPGGTQFGAAAYSTATPTTAITGGTAILAMTKRRV